MANDERLKPASISSRHAERTVVLRLSTVVKVVLIIALAGLSFWGGVLYGDSLHHSMTPPPNSQRHRYAVGLVVYISSTSITISNENNSGEQSFAITKKTLISLNGVRSIASQIQPGNIALIRVNPNNTAQAGVILVNSHFSG